MVARVPSGLYFRSISRPGFVPALVYLVMWRSFRDCLSMMKLYLRALPPGHYSVPTQMTLEPIRARFMQVDVGAGSSRAA